MLHQLYSANQTDHRFSLKKPTNPKDDYGVYLFDSRVSLDSRDINSVRKEVVPDCALKASRSLDSFLKIHLGWLCKKRECDTYDTHSGIVLADPGILQAIAHT